MREKISPAEVEPRLVFGNMEIDLDRHEVRLGEKVVDLKPKEYELLVYLAQNSRRALTR